MKKLILAILLLSGIETYAAKKASLATVEGNDGGGGGVICVTASKCVTLAEAGLRIRPTFENQQLSPSAGPEKPVIALEVTKEVQWILQQLPKTIVGSVWFKSHEIGLINPSKDLFKNVDLYDQEKFEKVKAEYYQILNENYFPSENLDIAAISDRNVTYLLPHFYKLNTRSQALILIHEAIVRRTGALAVENFNSVKFALEFDGFLVDILNKKPVDMYRLSAWQEKFILIAYHYHDPQYQREYANSRIKYGQFLNDPALQFMYTQKKKYKLSKGFLDAVTSNGARFFNNVYLVNEIFKENPEFWNYIKTFKIDRMTVGMLDLPKDFPELPPPMNVESVCLGAADGHYFVGSHIIKCGKFKMISYSSPVNMVIDKGMREVGSLCNNASMYYDYCRE